MPTDILIPQLGDSVTHGVIASWRKNDGDFVNRDEAVLELETDKVTMDIPAPAAGVLRRSASVGEQVAVGAAVGKIEESSGASAKTPAAPSTPAQKSVPTSNGSGAKASPVPSHITPVIGSGPASGDDDVRATPLARKLASDLGVEISAVHGTGAGGRVREQDVQAVADAKKTPTPASRPAAQASPAVQTLASSGGGGARREKMSQLRQRIAARLVEAQHTAAMLTTFNECDMSGVMALRAKHKEAFEKKHGVGLGFMSFFVKAVVGGLKSFPAVNASLVTSSGEMEVEYHDSQDIAIAVGTPKGLVVPVLRGCDGLSFAKIESGIKELALKAKDGKLTLADLQGGTFTITNGGIYGSLMSTPILNPPQTGILGMHAIKNRPIEDPKNPGHVVIRPMMYLALSYDHRLIDGSEAVQFLVAVKNAIEEPERLLIGM